MNPSLPGAVRVGKVGTVFVDGVDENFEQVKHGMAWHYKAYEREQSVDDRRTTQMRKRGQDVRRGGPIEGL